MNDYYDNKLINTILRFWAYSLFADTSQSYNQTLRANSKSTKHFVGQLKRCSLCKLTRSSSWNRRMWNEQWNRVLSQKYKKEKKLSLLEIIFNNNSHFDSNFSKYSLAIRGLFRETNFLIGFASPVLIRKSSFFYKLYVPTDKFFER